VESEPPEQRRSGFARGQAHVRAVRGTVVDLVEKPSHDATAQTSALVLHRSDDVCEVEVPAAVTDGSAHGDDMPASVLDMTERPAALDRTQRLGFVLGMQACLGTKAQIVRNRRWSWDEVIDDRSGSAHASQAIRSDLDLQPPASRSAWRTPSGCLVRCRPRGRRDGNDERRPASASPAAGPGRRSRNPTSRFDAA
jgi:hypothetical protein